ncbi:hypothetical protein CHF27_001145 [Romboutsia maritimum]|uniref:Copper transporter n=1 Tax=Romboutsia maritimum TaxID=2020948 RepID=A0A371IWH4_9FIRM|nr:copper transporter [Romboutsia maritimum]RDY24833.1 hypothetical protein CHF27_001145 [Romboutsia maritimum]
MHINMKYYIVTIGAIFIALGIGILVGFNLNYDQELSKQQSQVINDLDERFEALKETNDNLEDDLDKLGKDYNKTIEFINENVDKIIVNELTNKNIGIISTNENNDYTKDIEDVVNKANGKIAFSIVLKNSITDEVKLKEVSSKIGTEIKTTSDAIKYIKEALKGEDASDKLTYLQELGIIKLNTLGNEYTSYESVVIASSAEEKVAKTQFEKIDKNLINTLKEENKYIVAVQKQANKFPNIDLYTKDKVSTIDNVDEGVGKVSLAWILKQGNMVGKFGRLDSAESLLPYKK